LVTPVVAQPAAGPAAQPQAVPSTAIDEIRVQGNRDDRPLPTVQLELERATLEFYDKLNEVIIDEQYHVECIRGTTVDSRIHREFCYAGYQVEELRAKQYFVAQDIVYEPDHIIFEKERIFADIIYQAMAEGPSIAAAAERLVALQNEMDTLSGRLEFLQRREERTAERALDKALRTEEREERQEEQR
jgi:hypothetical protein